MAFVVSQCGRHSRLHLSTITPSTVKIASAFVPCMTACCMRKRLLSRLGLHERPRVSSERALRCDSWIMDDGCPLRRRAQLIHELLRAFVPSSAPLLWVAVINTGAGLELETGFRTRLSGRRHQPRMALPLVSTSSKELPITVRAETVYIHSC